MAVERRARRTAPPARAPDVDRGGLRVARAATMRRRPAAAPETEDRCAASIARRSSRTRLRRPARRRPGAAASDACRNTRPTRYARAMSDLAQRFADAQARIKPVTGLGSDVMLDL